MIFSNKLRFSQNSVFFRSCIEKKLVFNNEVILVSKHAQNLGSQIFGLYFNFLN